MVNALTFPAEGDTLSLAYKYCERLAREHYENFPVASLLLPASMRPHIAAIYAFARRADDFADEPGPDSAERLRLLDGWGTRLEADATVPDANRASAGDDFIFFALQHTIRTHALPRALFHDLLSAFRQDVVTTRYATWEDVLDYCRRSANPIGRLVLRIAGYRDESLARSSDALCTALQLTNFWQDFGRDWRAGRLYAPRTEQAACDAREADLEAGRMGAGWDRVLARAVALTRDRFAEGRGVCNGVSGRLRLELRVTWLGGARILERVDRMRDQLLTRRPALARRDVPSLLWQAARWT